MSDAVNRKGEIHHPKSGGHTLLPHFAAFGRVDKGARVSGVLVGQDSGERTVGRLVHLVPSHRDRKRQFWIMHFRVPKALQGEKHVLRLIDEATDHELDCKRDIDVRPSFGGITFPQPNTHDIPLEFAAYGAADPSGGDVRGTMSNCDTPPTDIEEINQPEDWALACYVVNPNPPCTLSVYQGPPGGKPFATAGGLTFGTS